LDNPVIGYSITQYPDYPITRLPDYPITHYPIIGSAVLLVAERVHRINPRRATGRQEAGGQGDEDQQRLLVFSATC
jgi:hypothetical protein